MDEISPTQLLKNYCDGWSEKGHEHPEQALNSVHTPDGQHLRLCPACRVDYLRYVETQRPVVMRSNSQ